MDVEQIMEAARGYLMLGMGREALDELSHLPKTEWFNPEVLALQIAILMKMKRWEDALKLLDPLTQLSPDVEEYHLHAAYCLHELARTPEAKEVLLAAPVAIHRNPLYHYNMACYEARLGDIESAKTCLRRCFAIDRHWFTVAIEDTDLIALQSWLKSSSK